MPPIDSHESDQRAEVEHVGAKIIAGGCTGQRRKQKRSSQSERADKQDIVARHVPFGIDRAKERLRESVAAPHAIEQPRRTHLRSHAGAEVRHQQSEPNNRK